MDRDLRIRMILEAANRVSQPLRDIASGSGRAAAAFKAARDRLKELERVQSDVAGFRQLKGELRGTEERLQAAQQRVRTLAQAMQASDAPTQKMAAEFAKAKREAAALGQESSEQARRLQALRDRLSEAGVRTTHLASDERALRAAVDAANRELSEQDRRLQRVNERAERFARARQRFGQLSGAATGVAASGMSAVGTGMAIGRPLAAGLGDAIEFQSVMTDIAQKADLTRQEGDQLGEKLLAAARAANKLPSELQEGADALAGFGLDPQRAVAMMAPIGRAATAYKAEIADLASAAFAVTDNLKVPVDQTARIIDVMAQAGKSGAFEIKDMAQYFPQLTAAYQGLGQKGVGAVGDLAAALQIARKGAGDSASAATNIANVLQKINSPATIRAFKKNFGVDLPAALKKAYAEGKTPLEAIAEITNKTLKGDLSKLGNLFEDAQVQQGLRPLIQNMKLYRDIRAQAMNAKGTTDKDFAERLNDTAEKLNAAKVRATELAVRIGGLLLPTVSNLLDVVNRAAEAVGNFAQKHPGLAKAIGISAGALAALFVVIGSIMVVIAAFMGPIAIINAGLVAMGVAGGVASVGLLPILGTIAAIVAAVALLAYGAYLIYNNWGAIGTFFSNLWNGATSSVSGAIGFIINLLSNFSPTGLMMSAFGALVAWLRGPLGQSLLSAGADLIRGLIRGITGQLANLKGAVVNAASSAANWFKSVMGIHSPSRVFAGFGGYMMEGLAGGIDRSLGQPIGRIDKLSRQIGAAMAITAAIPSAAVAAPAADMASRVEQVKGAIVTGTTGAPAAVRPRAAPPSPPAAPAAAGIGAITIQIIQQPGQDAKSLAEEVRRQIEALERARAAAKRSSFRTDSDQEDL